MQDLSYFIIALTTFFSIICDQPATGQTSAPLSYYRSDGLGTPTVRRVAFFPLENATSFPYAHLDFSEALATELRSSGLFELVPVDPHHLGPLPPPICSRGVYPEELLVGLRRRYQADAVIFGSLREYHPYWPPRVGVSIHLVGTAEAVPLAAADGLWDARNEDVATRARQFGCRMTALQTLVHSDLVLKSPRIYNKFVAQEIVHTLIASGPQVISGDADANGLCSSTPPRFHHSRLWFARWPRIPFGRRSAE